MRKIISFCLVKTLALGCSSNHQATDSIVNGIPDAELIEARQDGKFDVRCKDGRKEIATHAQIAKQEICMGSEPSPKPNPTKNVFCGKYDKTVIIGKGRNVVTCDTSFAGDVFIDAGAQIESDGTWSLSFSNTFAIGTEKNPIGFSGSTKSDSGTTGYSSITFSGRDSVLYTPAQQSLERKSGSEIKHMKINNTQTVKFENIYMSQSEIQADDLIIESSLVGSSLINLMKKGERNYDLPAITIDNSYLINNSISRKPNLVRDYFGIVSSSSFVAWNSIDQTCTVESKDLDQSYFAFNSIDVYHEDCNYAKDIVATRIGNKAKKTVGNIVANNNDVFGSCNPDSSECVLVGPLKTKRTLNVGIDADLSYPIVAADRSGWRFDIPIEMNAVSAEDGVASYAMQNWVNGFYPSLKLTKPESYSFEFRSRNPGETGSLVWPKIEIKYLQ